MILGQCTLAAFLLFGAAYARPEAQDRVTYPVVYENECSSDIMLNDTDNADYIVFGNSFVAEADGTLDRLSVYTELINCTNENVTLDIMMGVYFGDINDTAFRTDLLSTLDFATIAINESDGSENYLVTIADSYTCADFAAEESNRWALPALTFEFLESGDIFGVSTKWLTEGETYTWIMRYAANNDNGNAGDGTLGDICVGDLTDDDLELGTAFYSHAEPASDSYEPATLLTDSTFTMRLEMDEDLPNCSYSEDDYGRKIHWQVWYFDDPLRVISQYVEASEYSVWDAIVNNTATALALTDSEYKKKKYKFSKDEVQEFYDEVTADRCVLWANVWHMFGLCLATDNRCKGWKKVEDKDIVNNDDYQTYYQLEVYMRVAKENADGDKLNSDWFKLIHDILSKDQEHARSVMNADMPTRDRENFDAFSSRLMALRNYWFGAPAIAAWVVLGFVCFAILFAIVGAVHGFGFWHADNVRISGIILFALYTSDFYSDIVFDLNLINYYNRWGYLFWLTTVFIVVPWGMNMVALSRYQNKWCEDETVRERVYQWFVHWQRLLYALAALSGSAFGTVELANSYVFGYDFFCMGLNERHLKKFNNNRLWSGIVAENLPQLCIQFWFLYLTDFDMDQNTFTVYAIVLSSLSIGAAALDIYSSKKLFEALINPETGQYNDKSTLSFQVISPEIHENKARLQISTYQFRNMLAEVLMLESRAVEMHFPVATANGFKIRFSVFSRDKDADEIERIIRECIEHAEREKNLSTKIQTVWRLGAAPDVKDLKQEAQVEMAMTSTDAPTISIASASPLPQETDATVDIAGED